MSELLPQLDVRTNTNPEQLGCEDDARSYLACENSTTNPILVDPVGDIPPVE